MNDIQGIRILAAAQESLSDPQSRVTRNSGLFVALAARYEVVGAIRPAMGNVTKTVTRLRYFYPKRDAWRSRAGLSPWAFHSLTAAAERDLRDWDDRYDLIMLVQTVFAPGTHPHSRPYVVYTDNIHTLSARYFPAWAPLSARDRKRRIQLERMTCRGAKRVFAKSEFVRSAIVAEYECDPDRVIKVGVGANSLVPSLDGVNYDSAAALFVGIDFKRKGGDTLLDAWSSVRARLPNAQLWVVGPRRQPRNAQQPGIRWFGFVSDRSVLTDLYLTATAFVLPSLFEPYGLSFFEAMGHGLPCIGADRGAIREAIRNGENGLLIPPAEPEALADALVSLLGDPDRTAAMGRRAHAEVLAEHTWGRVVDRMAPHIERVVGGGLDG
jgi:glycosyltransferase involved in cell wall biosynthesis